MLNTIIRAARFSCVALTCCALLACTPPLDWREVRVTDTPYVVLMPAKPTAHTRTVKLDGTDIAMTMRGADVEGVTYAVGAVTLPDEARAASAARALQAALVRNLDGAVRQEKQLIVSGLPMTAIQVDGKNARGDAIRLHARFAARGPFAYQAVVLGAASKVSAEANDIFLDSFRPGQQ